MKIFLSYRREDTSGHAGRLYDLLARRYGAGQIFMDIDAIPVGSEFGRRSTARSRRAMSSSP